MLGEPQPFNPFSSRALGQRPTLSPAEAWRALGKESVWVGWQRLACFCTPAWKLQCGPVQLALPDSGYSFAKWDRTPPGTAGSACESQGVCSPSLCSPQCLAPGLAEPSRRGLICFSMLQSQEALSAPVQEVEQREVRLGLLGGCGHRGGLPGGGCLVLAGLGRGGKTDRGRWKMKRQKVARAAVGHTLSHYAGLWSGTDLGSNWTSP